MHSIYQQLYIADVPVTVGNRSLMIGRTAIPLTRSEQRLVRRLFQTPGQIVPYSELTRCTYQRAVTVNTVCTHILNIRRKVADRLPSKSWIFNKPGVGYGLAA